MEEVLYYKIEVNTGDANRKLLGEMTAQLKVLNDEYKKLISSKEKDVAAIGRNREQVSALTKDINNLSKSIISSTAASEKDAAEKIKFANDIKNANNRLEEAYAKAEAKREAKIQANTFEAGSIAALRQELSKATMAYDRMGEAERNSAAGKQMETSIAMQVQALNKLEQATGRFQRQVGNYNTAGVAMSQVLREIPAFTFSAQTGILALSNNIPILVDEMKRISTSIDAVTGKKAGWKGAFAQMGANLLSMGGILTIALGLFTIFSDKIVEAITGTEELTDAQKDLQKQMEDTDRLIYENTLSWQELRGEITGLSKDLLLLEYDYKKTLVNIEAEQDKKIADATDNVSKLGYVLKAWALKWGGLYKGSLLGDGLQQEEVIKIVQETNDAIAELDREYEAKKEALRIREEERNKGNAKKSRERLKKDKEVELKEQLSLQNEIYQALIDQMREGEEKKLEEERLRYKIALEETKKFYNDGVHTKAEVDRLLEEMEKVHQKNIDDIINKAREEREKERLKGLESVKKTLDDYDKYIEEKEKKAADEKLEKEKKDAADIKKVKQNLWGSLSEAENLYFKMQEDALERHLKRQIRAIDQDAARQTDILKNRLDKGLISEAQYNADKAELDRQAEANKQKAEKEAFEKQKKLAKAKIAVDTSVAIVKGYAEMNWVAATIQGVALTGLAALQLAAVDAQEFAEGGLVLDKNKNIPTKPNGDSVLTTLTPGEIVLNKQQQAMLGGNETFARIGVPNVPNIYPNAASGGSMSSVTKKDFQIMFNNLQNGINSKKVYQLESEAKRTRNTVENYETSNKW